MSKVDILMATYNGAKYISEQITSLLNQSYTDWRLIIRDDCSSDETINIIKKVASEHESGKIIILDNKGVNLGSSQSFSELIICSTAEYVMLCDQDDWWLPNKVELAVREIEALESEYGKSKPLMVFTDLCVVDNKLEIKSNSFIDDQKLYVSAIEDPHKIMAHNVIAGCTTIMNRAAINCSSPIPNIGIVHDQWISVNIAHYGKIKYLDKATILYRQHNSNVVGANNIGFRYLMNKMFVDNRIRNYFVMMDNLSFKTSKMKFLWYKFIFSIRRIF